MIITVDNGTTFDTDKDFTAEERHILQKLILWKTIVNTMEEFREKKKQALEAGWNNSGPVKESRNLAMVIRNFEKQLQHRLDAGE